MVSFVTKDPNFIKKPCNIHRHLKHTPENYRAYTVYTYSVLAEFSDIKVKNKSTDVCLQLRLLK